MTCRQLKRKPFATVEHLNSSNVWTTSMNDATLIMIETSDRLQELLYRFLHNSKSVDIALVSCCLPTNVQIYLKFSRMVGLRETWLHNPNGTKKKVLSFIENLSRDA